MKFGDLLDFNFGSPIIPLETEIPASPMPEPPRFKPGGQAEKDLLKKVEYLTKINQRLEAQVNQLTKALEAK